ncbi:MAG: hypothetical protein RB191_06380, partial [Terriglobia bacterium]|nr:hypothetical protein [Terriglobia bacterium]
GVGLGERHVHVVGCHTEILTHLHGLVLGHQLRMTTWLGQRQHSILETLGIGIYFGRTKEKRFTCGGLSHCSLQQH